MQQHGSKIFLQADPPPYPLGVGSKVKIQLNQNMVMLHIKLKESWMQQHLSKYFARILPPPLPTSPTWPGVKRSKSNFSEQAYVAYQIKWNYKCSNIVADILPSNPKPPTPRPWGGGGDKRSKFIFFHNMVMLHIKLIKMTHAATW